MSIESTSEFTRALMARVARYEYLRSKLGRMPTDAEMGDMPTPDDVDIMLGEIEHDRKRAALVKVCKPKQWTRPSDETMLAATIERSRQRANGIKARTGGLLGVVKNSGGTWSARFTPPKPSQVKSCSATFKTMEEAVEGRNAMVRRYYGETRPWLFAECPKTKSRKRYA